MKWSPSVAGWAPILTVNPGETRWFGHFCWLRGSQLLRSSRPRLNRRYVLKRGSTGPAMTASVIRSGADMKCAGSSGVATATAEYSEIHRPFRLYLLPKPNKRGSVAHGLPGNPHLGYESQMGCVGKREYPKNTLSARHCPSCRRLAPGTGLSGHTPSVPASHHRTARLALKAWSWASCAISAV